MDKNIFKEFRYSFWRLRRQRNPLTETARPLLRRKGRGGFTADKFPSLVPLGFFSKHREKLKKVVLVGGAFDIIHAGHIEHLKKAKSLGDILVVHITSDQRVREKKGDGRPVFNEKERALFVSAIRFVDYVFIHDGRHYDLEIIEAIKPDVIFFNKESYNRKIGTEVKKKFKGKIIVSNDKKINSTSKILQLASAEEKLQPPKESISS